MISICLPIRSTVIETKLHAAKLCVIDTSISTGTEVHVVKNRGRLSFADIKL